MAQANDKYSVIIQNLIDSGIDKTIAEKYTQQLLDGNASDTIVFLRKHRKNLLDEVHKNQKQIDCLDFLLYQLRKELNYV
ncbi:MAG: hypothetical protein NC205_08245 [Prevotella sp.]|nr:hypothetical protein [Alistipes senegalensis]MCM1358573.1 hypothetical protein [Prevotella sp.]MCM1474440.1 hypothetical protein [Muribaculaceae bacterium]